MQEKDITTTEYFEDPERFADLVNGFLFDGDQMINAQDVYEIDRVISKKWKKSEWIRAQIKIRDLMRQVDFGMQVVLIALENQSDIHYAMPVRVMSADAAVYENQVQRKQKEHEKTKNLKKGEEYLSKFGKEDKILPTITIVIHWGKDAWDGPRSIKEMMDLSKIPGELRKYIEDYHIKLLEVRKYPFLQNFRTDMQYVFGFLQNAENIDELEKYVKENERYFSNMKEDAYDMVRMISNTKELKKIKREDNKGGIDMCEGIRQMVERGEKQGFDNGIKIAKKLFKMRESGISYEEMAKACNISAQVVRNILEDEVT